MTTLLDTPCSTRDCVPDRSDLSQLSAFRSDPSHERFPLTLNKPHDNAFEDDEESGHITHFSPSSFKTPTKESSSPGSSELPSMPSEKSNSRGFSGECSSGGCPMFEVTDTERSTSDCSLSPNVQRIEVSNGGIISPALSRLEDTIDSVLEKLENGSYRESGLSNPVRQPSATLSSPPSHVPSPRFAAQATCRTNPQPPPSPRLSQGAFSLSGWCTSAAEAPHSFYEVNGYQWHETPADRRRAQASPYPNNPAPFHPYETSQMATRTFGMSDSIGYMCSPFPHPNDLSFLHEKYLQSTARYPSVSPYSYPNVHRGHRHFGAPNYTDYRFMHPSDPHYYTAMPYSSTPNRTRSRYSSTDEAKVYYPNPASLFHMRSHQSYTGIFPDPKACDTPIHCDIHTTTVHSIPTSYNHASSKNICSTNSSPTVASQHHFVKNSGYETYGDIRDRKTRNRDYRLTPEPGAVTIASSSSTSYVNCTPTDGDHAEVSISKSSLHSNTLPTSLDVQHKPSVSEEGSKRRLQCAPSMRGTKRRRLVTSKYSSSSVSSVLTENIVRSILLHNASQYLHDPVIHLPVTLCSPIPTPTCTQSASRLPSNERLRVLDSRDGFCESPNRKYSQFPMCLRSPTFRCLEDSTLCGLLTQSTAERAQYGKLISDNFLLNAVQRASSRSVQASYLPPCSPLQVPTADSGELLNHLSHEERLHRDSFSPVIQPRAAKTSKPIVSANCQFDRSSDYSELIISSEVFDVADYTTCAYCLMQIMAPEDAIRWRLPDGDSRIVFCSSVCFLAYQNDATAEKRFTSVPQVPGTCVTSVASLLSDRDRTVPVFLKRISSTKWVRGCGKKSIYEKVNRRRQASQTAHVRELLGFRTTPWRWNRSRWRKFHGPLLSRKQHFQLADVRRKSRSTNIKPRTVASCYANVPIQSEMGLTHPDHRVCLLCHQVGDAVEHVAGRLLNYDFDVWLHLNCILWCYDTYETVSGSLVHVARSLKKAEKTLCSHCGRSGAGLPCFHSDCPSVYHVPCAHKIGCSFYGDRGMYCPEHNLTESTYPRLTSLAVDRRVFIARDEDAQVGGIILRVNPLLDAGSLKNDVSARLRVGSLILHSVGQLLPEQLSSGLYHTTNFIYPVGYSSTRIYWSYRHVDQRCRYHCRIEDNIAINEADSDANRSCNLGAKFVVQVDEINESAESFEDVTCDGVWQQILTRINQKRRVPRSSRLRIFQNHLIGEVLYGLTEPHIVRAIESLPGVDRLNNYVFKFGRLQLIQEMPLAINPTGCARSEPKLRTHVRRRHISDAFGSQHTPLTRKPTGIHGTCTPQRSSPGSPVYLSSSSSVIQSKSQQYRRLSTEWKMNVVLARSRIQGLGLYAARDISKHTFIIEYLGELIRNEVGNRRERLYESQNRGVYMFRVDDDYIVDATMCGGLARYINHSCDPNCTAEVLTCDNGSHIIIIARRNIEKGEELTYDYKFDIEEDRWDRIPCLCGAPSCRQWMN